MATEHFYPIGRPGEKWSEAERSQWRDSRKVQRSYQTEVVDKIQALSTDIFDVAQYGALSHDPERYPLFYAKTKNWAAGKPSVLVTGGVHGYETSGVQGCIQFLRDGVAEAFSETFNIIALPCVSPWGYECIERWVYNATDPNRSFSPDGEVVPGRSFNPEPATDESRAVIALLATLGVEQWTCHIDLHETTDTDDTEFRPAKAARDGTAGPPDDSIPDGFYLVADSTKPNPDWWSAMIEAVRSVTHIAPPDAEGNIIGEKMVQDGVIAIPAPSSLGLCAGVTNATFAATTEVYPDSPRATDAICNDAQVACVKGALEWIKENHHHI